MGAVKVFTVLMLLALSATTLSLPTGLTIADSYGGQVSYGHDPYGHDHYHYDQGYGHGHGHDYYDNYGDNYGHSGYDPQHHHHHGGYGYGHGGYGQGGYYSHGYGGYGYNYRPGSYGYTYRPGSYVSYNPSSETYGITFGIYGYGI